MLGQGVAGMPRPEQGRLEVFLPDERAAGTLSRDGRDGDRVMPT